MPRSIAMPRGPLLAALGGLLTLPANAQAALLEACPVPVVPMPELRVRLADGSIEGHLDL